MNHGRETVNFNRSWLFYPEGKLPDEVLLYENHQIINDETNLWQKAGNFGVSKPDNPHTETWRQVDLPHDYAIEGEFTSQAAAKTGALKHRKAWYVKKFSLPQTDQGKRINIEFDGIFRNCSVFVNGHFVKRHLSGYTSFEVDITDLCYFGADNAVAVHVDATDNELWSYEGAGIYRNVRLAKTAPVFVPQWGTYVTTGSEDQPGSVKIETRVCNMSYNAVTCEVTYRILSPSGELVTRTDPAPVDVAAIDETTLNLETEIDNPELWSIDDPKLYTLVTTIKIDQVEVDSYQTTFGVRYFKFVPESGFYLNGVNLKLKGTCCHQDHACVGVAVPPKLQEWRVAQLKALGCNAIRTSHNPPDPALLNACDRLGMLVMDEIRIPGIAEELLEQLESLIRRDRNHPSVILWSLGNEEMAIQDTQIGINIFRRMQHLAHRLDPSRPTTYATNCDWINICDFQNDSGFRFDVFGANYRSDQRSENYDDFHRKYPDWPLIGAETFGGASTRGLYEPDRSNLPLEVFERWRDHPDLWRDEKFKNVVSAYGGTRTPWGYSIEETWQDCANRPFMAGTFIWTGFDYRGETFPYDWPAVVTRFGILDLCGFYKEIAHYLRAWWRPEDPHIFIMPHWNWQGQEGEPINVWCYANCHSVELFLNGESLGKKEMPKNFRLEWVVPFAPGTLEAKGYDQNGVKVNSTYRRTTGAPASIKLIPSTLTIQADGEDVVVVNVMIVDQAGDVCALADNTVEFSVEGPLEILGVGNGNPVSHEPDKFNSKRRAYHGLCQIILKSTDVSGPAKLAATSWQLASGEVEFEVRA
jgi:beta-galactosidase